MRKVTPLPLIPKLTPNVTDVASFARAAEEAGADAVSLVNTFLAMAIDVETRRPKILEHPRRSERSGDSAHRGPDGVGVLPVRQDSDHRHGRYRRCRRCGRVHAGRIDGGADRHGEFLRSVRLDQGARRPRRLPAATQIQRVTRSDRRRSTRRRGRKCTREPDPRRAGRRVRGAERERWPTRCAAASAASRSASSSLPQRAPRSCARSPSAATESFSISSFTTFRIPSPARSRRRSRPARGWSTSTPRAAAR